MPPRRTRASQSAAVGVAEPAAPSDASEEATARPAKRARTSAAATNGSKADDGNVGESASEPSAIFAPPPPTNDPAPVSPPDLPPPPPPPADAAPPPPDDPAPVPPPQEEEDDDALQGAEYWARMAQDGDSVKTKGAHDLYLDTISRPHLDFDFEKLCSVTMANINIYACLVCGRYYGGRGLRTQAYFHSINEDHRVFMSLSNGEVYILPENYMVRSGAFADIQYLLSPSFDTKALGQLDAPDLALRPRRDLIGRTYLPGFVGLNNVGANDYSNVVLQALAHVKPLRNYFLRGGPRSTNSSMSGANHSGAIFQPFPESSELVRRFSLLLRKMHNPRAFKAQVSPHDLLQEVARCSSGRFSITQQGDPVEFMGWLLNRLHMDLGGGRKRESIISRCFQGQVRVESQQVFVRSGVALDGDEDKLDGDGRKEGGQEDAFGKAKFNIDREITSSVSPFLLLALDLPPPPVFQDVLASNIIPQVPLAAVLAKYDGVSFQEAAGMIRRYKVMRLPPYVVLHFRRFTKNNFVEERNPTIVNFPIQGLDLRDYVEGSHPDLATRYNLVANVTHEATAGTVREDSVWRSQVHTRVDGVRLAPRSDEGTGVEQGAEGRSRDEDDENATSDGEEKWFQIQDLIVEPINRQMLFLSETYIQVWERKDAVEEVESAMDEAERQKQQRAKKGAAVAAK